VFALVNYQPKTSLIPTTQERTKKNGRDKQELKTPKIPERDSRKAAFLNIQKPGSPRSDFYKQSGRVLFTDSAISP